MRQNLKGLLCGLTAAFLFACIGGISLFLSEEIPVSQILFIQNAVGLLILLPFFPSFQPTSNHKLYLFRSAAGALSSFAFTSALKDLDLVDATLLNMTAPFFLPLIGLIWLKEKVHWAIWPLLGLGFYGASLIYPPSRSMFQFGGFFALASGFLTALSLSCVRKLHQKNEPCMQIVIAMALFGVLFNGTLCLFSWQPMSSEEWLLAIGGGVFLGMNQLLLTKSFQLLPIGFLAPISYAVFPFSALITGFIYREPVDLTTWIGALLICCSGVLARRFSAERSPLQN